MMRSPLRSAPARPEVGLISRLVAGGHVGHCPIITGFARTEIAGRR
jgi:hypothetical protein